MHCKPRPYPSSNLIATLEPPEEAVYNILCPPKHQIPSSPTKFLSPVTSTSFGRSPGLSNHPSDMNHTLRTIQRLARPHQLTALFLLSIIHPSPLHNPHVHLLLHRQPRGIPMKRLHRVHHGKVVSRKKLFQSQSAFTRQTNHLRKSNTHTSNIIFQLLPQTLPPRPRIKS